MASISINTTPLVLQGSPSCFMSELRKMIARSLHGMSQCYSSEGLKNWNIDGAYEKQHTCCDALWWHHHKK